MGLIKTRAMVLRTFEYSETSLVVWFFTRSHGRLHAIAKGARRSRSEFEGALEPFVLCDIEVYRKEKRELDILGALDLVDLHFDLRRSLERLTWASHIVELLSETIQLDEPTPEFFDEACRSLRLLIEAPLSELPKISLAFELRLLGAIGLFPVLDRCVVCEEAVDEVAVCFHPWKGGVLCAEHQEGALRAHRGSLRSLLYLAEGEDVSRIEVSGAILRECRKLLNAYWRHQLEKDLRCAKALWGVLPPAG